MLTIRPIAAQTSSAIALAAPLAPYLQRLAERVAREEDNAPLANPIENTMRALRREKAALHLKLAGDDLCGARAVMDVTRALSVFARDALQRSLDAALHTRDLTSSGIFLVALGKLGAFELNYSSDIDIAAFYDPSVFDGGERGPSDSAQRVVRDIVRLMDDLTEDGYVFRTDLRLRPDPGSTPLAVSTEMAEAYYESVGQNWERMVWIKGAVAAGDSASGAQFLKRMEPYVWRRHLDYWALADIQAIKRMINAKIGDDAFETVSADVKLSPGGIREIEFFAQTQQLILGGRDRTLRDNTTLGALQALRTAGVVSDTTRHTLSEAYRQLRMLEHRIQMRHDEQTHILPEDETERGALSELCGYGTLAAFDTDVLETRRAVHEIYRALFAAEDRAAGTSRLGNLVFTGVDDDPGTVETLHGLGFSEPSPAIDAIRNWHRGHVPATRTVRGRELLTALLPGLLEAMGKTGDADAAFHWFSRFFGGLTSGVQTLSMLLAQPKLLDDLAATLALAPRLAEILSRRPDLLEPLVAARDAEAPVYSPDTDYSAALDLWRRYHREQAFLIGHRLLHGQISPVAAAADYSDLADASIRYLAAATADATRVRAGETRGRWAVFALGKLGGREMTAGSDLDLMVIYDGDFLETVTYYTRFTQRLITALTAPTAEGALYEVDMRLRPSGRKGPVAVHADSFKAYQRDEAWTWEHMAMTRLRFVAGDAGLGADIIAAAHGAIVSRSAARADQIRHDVGEMRALLHREKPGQGLWDLKMAPGGLIDLEFISQQTMLLAGEASLIGGNTAEMLVRLAEAGAAPQIDWSALSAAFELLQHLQQIERVAIGQFKTGETLPRGLAQRLFTMTGHTDFAGLEADLAARKVAVSREVMKILTIPATETVNPPV